MKHLIDYMGIIMLDPPPSNEQMEKMKVFADELNKLAASRKIECLVVDTKALDDGIIGYKKI